MTVILWYIGAASISSLSARNFGLLVSQNGRADRWLKTSKQILLSPQSPLVYIYLYIRIYIYYIYTHIFFIFFFVRSFHSFSDRRVWQNEHTEVCCRLTIFIEMVTLIKIAPHLNLKISQNISGFQSCKGSKLLYIFVL